MEKLKKFFLNLSITIVLWTVSRFIPALIGQLLSGSTILTLFVSLIMLPIGWYVAQRISKHRYAGCIRINLYLFMLIESSGLLEIFGTLFQNFTFYTGRYSTDMNGIPYSDYSTFYGLLLLFEIAYIALCFYFIKKERSTSISDESNASIDSALTLEPVENIVSPPVQDILANDSLDNKPFLHHDKNTAELRNYKIPFFISLFIILLMFFGALYLADVRYQQGYETGSADTYAVAHDAGYNSGYADGHTSGMAVCEQSHSYLKFKNQYKQAFKKDMDATYRDGYSAGCIDYKNGDVDLSFLTIQALMEIIR